MIQHSLVDIPKNYFQREYLRGQGSQERVQTQFNFKSLQQITLTKSLGKRGPISTQLKLGQSRAYLEKETSILGLILSIQQKNKGEGTPPQKLEEIISY